MRRQLVPIRQVAANRFFSLGDRRTAGIEAQNIEPRGCAEGRATCVENRTRPSMECGINEVDEIGRVAQIKEPCRRSESSSRFARLTLAGSTKGMSGFLPWNSSASVKICSRG